MSMPARENSRRGGALLVVVFACAVLAAAAGMYFYSVSHQLSTEMRVRDNLSTAQDHAAFASSLAISRLGDVEYGTVATETGDMRTVEKDWVAREPYAESGDGQYERRIAGRVGGATDGYEYSARVIPLREAHQNNAGGTMLQEGVDAPDYEYGKDPARAFSAAYEVTAAARSVSAAATPELAGEGQVQTIVTLKGESAYNDLDKLATFHSDRPKALLFDNPEPLSGGRTRFMPSWSKTKDNIGTIFQVAGEDHYSIRTMAQTGIIDQVLDGLRALKALPTEYFTTLAGWWDFGKLSIQYRVGETPNPHIPRTRKFSNNPIDRQMISLDGEREPDIYFSGGKQGVDRIQIPRFYASSNIWTIMNRGRTITIGTDGLINETTDDEARQDDIVTGQPRSQRSLAIGSPEDFMKLYINYSGRETDTELFDPSAGDAAMRDWMSRECKQVSFAHYPKNATTVNPPAIPAEQGLDKLFYSPRDNHISARRRSFPLLIMLMNKDGAMLVREYDGDYEQMGDDTGVPPNKWHGTYTWMYRFYMGNMVGISFKGYAGGWAIPSTRNPFLKKTSRNMNPRRITLPEFIGYNFTTDDNGVPAKLENGQVVAGVPDFALDPDGGRIPYYPEKDEMGRTIEGNNFNESWWRDTSEGDNWGVDEETLALMPPTDGIYVRIQPDDEEYESGFPGGVPDEGYWQAPDERSTDGVVRRYKRYQTLRDFSFQRDIGTDEEPEVREVNGIFLSFDLYPDNDLTRSYYTLEMSASIVWPERSVVAGEDPAMRFRHWWEGRAQEGLTGATSYRPISAAAGADVLGLPPEERLQGLFETMGVYEPDFTYLGINNMLGADGGMAGFNKVTFDTANDIGRANRLSPWNESESPYYFYGNDELWGVATALYAQEHEDLFTGEELSTLESLKEAGDIVTHNLKWEEFLMSHALDAVNAKKEPGIVYLPYDRRFGAENGRVQAILAKDIAGEPNPHLDSLLAVQNEVTGRSLSAMTFGQHRFRAPAVHVWESGGSLTRMRESDFGLPGGGYMPPVEHSVTLIPGELNALDGSPVIENETYNVGESPEIYPWLKMLARDNGEPQMNGRPIKPKFIWFDDPPAVNSSGDRDEGMGGIRTPPEWFTTVDPETGVVLHDAMMLGSAGLTLGGYHREHRGAIGWHREGQGALPPVNYDEPDAAGEEGYNAARKLIHKKIFGDHFEYVILSSREDPSTGTEPAGFFPFVTMDTADGEGNQGRFLALFRPEDEDPLTTPDPDTFVPRLRPSSEMPTFVIDGEELDGAGIMVVNGNLHLKTRFAYHGLLVVLGDITIEPTYREMYDRLGNRLDAENEAIKDVNGEWYVIDPHTREVKLDSEGLPVKSVGGPVSEWLGGLVAQGKVVAGGKVVVAPEIRDSDGNLVQPPGTVDIRTSRKAVEDAMGTWIKVGPNERLVASQHGWSTGNTVSDIVIGE